MSRKLNQKSSIYTYLKSSGVLEHGTPDLIQSARKTYWKEYRSKWRNKRRQTDKEFTISFNSEEVKELTREAKRHKLSRPKFIKLAFFGYVNKSFVVPESIAVRRIAQLLAMSYNQIQQLLEVDKFEYNTGKSCLKVIWNLEREILPMLNNPKLLEMAIADYIKKSPNNKADLLRLISEL